MTPAWLTPFILLALWSVVYGQFGQIEVPDILNSRPDAIFNLTRTCSFVVKGAMCMRNVEFTPPMCANLGLLMNSVEFGDYSNGLGVTFGAGWRSSPVHGMMGCKCMQCMTINTTTTTYPLSDADSKLTYWAMTPSMPMKGKMGGMMAKMGGGCGMGGMKGGMKGMMKEKMKGMMGGNMQPMGGNMPAQGGNMPAPGGNMPAPGGNMPAPGGNMPAMGGGMPMMGGGMGGDMGGMKGMMPPPKGPSLKLTGKMRSPLIWRLSQETTADLLTYRQGAVTARSLAERLVAMTTRGAQVAQDRVAPVGRAETRARSGYQPTVAGLTEWQKKMWTTAGRLELASGALRLSRQEVSDSGQEFDLAGRNLWRNTRQCQVQLWIDNGICPAVIQALTWSVEKYRSLRHVAIQSFRVAQIVGQVARRGHELAHLPYMAYKMINRGAEKAINASVETKAATQQLIVHAKWLSDAAAVLLEGVTESRDRGFPADTQVADAILGGAVDVRSLGFDLDLETVSSFDGKAAVHWYRGATRYHDLDIEQVPQMTANLVSTWKQTVYGNQNRRAVSANDLSSHVTYEQEGMGGTSQRGEGHLRHRRVHKRSTEEYRRSRRSTGEDWALTGSMDDKLLRALALEGKVGGNRTSWQDISALTGDDQFIAVNVRRLGLMLEGLKILSATMKNHSRAVMALNMAHMLPMMVNKLLDRLSANLTDLPVLWLNQTQQDEVTALLDLVNTVYPYPLGNRVARLGSAAAVQGALTAAVEMDADSLLATPTGRLLIADSTTDGAQLVGKLGEGMIGLDPRDLNSQFLTLIAGRDQVLTLCDLEYSSATPTATRDCAELTVRNRAHLARDPVRNNDTDITAQQVTDVITDTQADITGNHDNIQEYIDAVRAEVATVLNQTVDTMEAVRNVTMETAEQGEEHKRKWLDLADYILLASLNATLGEHLVVMEMRLTALATGTKNETRVWELISAYSGLQQVLTSMNMEKTNWMMVDMKVAMATESLWRYGLPEASGSTTLMSGICSSMAVFILLIHCLVTDTT